MIVKEVTMLDVSGPSWEVEVRVSDDGESMWVNVDGQCLLRVQNIPYGLLKLDLPLDISHMRIPR